MIKSLINYVNHCRSLSFLAMPRKEIPRKVLMVCAPRKDYVLKLEITLARFATQQNQPPSFHLSTQNAWMKANPLQTREIVYCFVWILIINLGYLKDILLTVEYCKRTNCVLPVV